MKSAWIGAPGGMFCDPAMPAPYFRRVLKIDTYKKAEVKICGLGYFELYLNGEKVGTRELDPVVSVYDRRVPWGCKESDMTKQLNNK